MVAALGNQYAAIPPARRAEIMRAVAAGLRQGTPLTIICEGLQAQGRFHNDSVYNWLKNDPEAKLAIEYGRDLGHDMIARECLTIADDRSDDVAYDADGFPHPNSAAVLRARLRIETRLKLLAKWGPKYSDDKTLRVEGEITQTTRHVLDPAQLDDAGRASLRALLDYAAQQGLLPGPEPEAQDADFVEVSDADEGA